MLRVKNDQETLDSSTFPEHNTESLFGPWNILRRRRDDHLSVGS